MRKVVVTGGAGFIGSHLAEELSARGNRVFVIDDLSTGKLENIRPLTDSGAVDFVKGSITSLPLLREYFRDAETVFHLAAMSSVPQSVANPPAAHEANATGTLNVLMAARDCKVSKVVYASSCAVYGDSPALPKQETMTPEPQSPYAAAKLTGEFYCRVFSQSYGLPAACLRYFNVYGPRQDPASQYAAVIPAFIQAVTAGEAPVIYGDGTQTRDFVYVKDVVAANLIAAESDAVGVFNIGSGRATSINDLTETIIGLAGGNVAPVHREPRQGDILHSLADISRAAAIGYRPGFSLEQGLRETIAAWE